MLHVKFHDHRLLVSREEEFYRFLPYMGMVATYIDGLYTLLFPLPIGDSLIDGVVGIVFSYTCI